MKRITLSLLAAAMIGGCVTRPTEAPTRTMSFETDEGTFMCVDVSPDGTTVLFDLLGDLYTIPIAGGTPTAISSGIDWDRCPRYSPNGKQVAFISDRVGIENLWILDLESRQVR